jgi:hypothetical protein
MLTKEVAALQNLIEHSAGIKDTLVQREAEARLTQLLSEIGALRWTDEPGEKKIR